MVLAQDLLKAQGKGARLVHAPLQDQARNVAREAGRQRDEPFVPLREQVHVDAGLVVVALDEPGRAELDEVLIALLVFAQEHQVRVFAGDLGLVKAAALGDVDLAPDDRVNARLLAGLVEVDHAVHHAVVRNRQGLHAQLLGALHQRPMRQAPSSREYSVCRCRCAKAMLAPLLFLPNLYISFSIPRFGRFSTSAPDKNPRPTGAGLEAVRNPRAGRARPGRSSEGPL